MLKGFAFKILPPKDIAKVLSAVGHVSSGAHPPVTADSIDKPTPETAAHLIQILTEYAYDMEIQQVKISTQMPGVFQHAEIYDEALDVLSVFRWSRQLAIINHVEDFNFKDLWDPSSKRFRAILSAIINFCRYKESRVVAFEGMKEDLHALDDTRLELVAKSNHMEEELVQAQEKHSQELHDTWAVEQEVQEIRVIVDKRVREKQSAERLVEDLEAKLGVATDAVKEVERRIALGREQVTDMQARVAEDPEGIEREIEEHNCTLDQFKARLAEKGDEKRARVQRDQVLNRLMTHCDAYKLELENVRQAARSASAARSRNLSASEELLGLRSSKDAIINETAELELGVSQVTEKLEIAKQAHADRLPVLESRRQQALVLHEELQSKRTDEQKQHHAMQSQRQELEVEVENARRSLESELNDLHAEYAAVMERREHYEQQMDLLLTGYKGEMSSSSRRAPSPDVDDTHGARRVGGQRCHVESAASVLHRSCPSPARVPRGRRGVPASPYCSLP